MANGTWSNSAVIGADPNERFKRHAVKQDPTLWAFAGSVVKNRKQNCDQGTKQNCNQGTKIADGKIQDVWHKRPAKSADRDIGSHCAQKCSL